MITLKTILVATDFSRPSDAALMYGRALARTFGATLHVVHVVGNVSSVVYGAEAYLHSAAQLQQDIEDAARTQLAELLLDDLSAVPTRQAILRSDAPAAAIVSYAREHEIDVIVSGTGGRGGVAHWLTGSVAERIVRTAPCPVLTVRHPEHEFVVPDQLVAVRRA